ncbi:hypothetical protein [Aquibacillus sediminis]|nr:hypothetical protein [Aquibacillus sediminis]
MAKKERLNEEAARNNNLDASTLKMNQGRVNQNERPKTKSNRTDK